MRFIYSFWKWTLKSIIFISDDKDYLFNKIVSQISAKNYILITGDELDNLTIYFDLDGKSQLGYLKYY
jgi:hypothetical protein